MWGIEVKGSKIKSILESLNKTSLMCLQVYKRHKLKFWFEFFAIWQLSGPEKTMKGT